MGKVIRGQYLNHALERLPFIVELFINGGFILLYSLHRSRYFSFIGGEELIDSILTFLSWIVPLVILFSVVGHYILASSAIEFVRKYIFSVITLVPLLITWGDMELAYWLGAAHLIAAIFYLYGPGPKNRKKSFGIFFPQGSSFFLKNVKFKPAQLVILLFLIVILGGSFLLALPYSRSAGASISLIDAFFVATSATCVTGLSTLSLVKDFSGFGQIVILALIQIGGLGIMTISSSVTILLGKSLARKDRIVMQELFDISSQEELFQMIIGIIRYTFWIELWGGLILTVAFILEGFEFRKAIYFGFFHSISAFCNAGFSLFPDSLESFSGNPMIYLPISALVILGGLGFIVLKEVKLVILRRIKLIDICLHSKIVLFISIILTVMGTFVFFFGEFLGAMDEFTLFKKLGNAFFYSVTLRTAGFSTIPLGQFQTHSIYFMTLLMFIGASPGSTGGGIKTSTFAILIRSISSTLRGRSRVEFFGHAIPSLLIVKATALSIISVIVTTSFIFIMSMVEHEQSFLTIFFEVVSASGTVGLSLGITPYLTVLGKFLISILMFVARVGPLTLILAIGEQKKSVGKFEYPEGRLMIG